MGIVASYTPTFNVREFTTPLHSFINLAGGRLVAACGNTIDTLASRDGGEALLRLFNGSLDIPDGYYMSLELMKAYMGRFVKSGVMFTTAAINLATMASPDMPEREIYDSMTVSYSGMGKRFTGSQSRADINLAGSMAGEYPLLLLDEVEHINGGFRSRPSIVKTAVELAGPQKRDDMHRAFSGYPLGSAICPASIDMGEGDYVAAEKVWKWTIGVAEGSGLVEKLKSDAMGGTYYDLRGYSG